MCGARLALCLVLSLLAWPSFSESASSADEGLISSQDFLAAVTALNETMSPAQKSELTTVLRYYAGRLAKTEETLTDSEATIRTLSERSVKREATLTKLYESLAQERAQNLLSDGLALILGTSVAALTSYVFRDAPAIGAPGGVAMGTGIGVLVKLSF